MFLCVEGLKDAINRRNYEVLIKAIEKAENSCHADRLTSLIEQARGMIDSLPAWNRHLHDVLEMRQSTISELTSYHVPSSVIQAVLTATLVMLGEERGQLVSGARGALPHHSGCFGRSLTHN